MLRTLCQEEGDVKESLSLEIEILDLALSILEREEEDPSNELERSNWEAANQDCQMSSIHEEFCRGIFSDFGLVSWQLLSIPAPGTFNAKGCVSSSRTIKAHVQVCTFLLAASQLSHCLPRP